MSIRKLQTILKDRSKSDATDIFESFEKSDPRFDALLPWSVGVECVERFQKVLAKGSSGAVYRAFLYGRVVACKVLNLISHENVDSFLTEAFLLSSCSHPSIIQLVGVCLNPLEPSIMLWVLVWNACDDSLRC